MEKDIEILESFIRQLEIYEDEELKQVIERLINRVKELEKENKRWEELAEEILIDGIPIEDYGKPTSRTAYSINYNEEINIKE